LATVKQDHSIPKRRDRESQRIRISDRTGKAKIPPHPRLKKKRGGRCRKSNNIVSRKGDTSPLPRKKKPRPRPRLSRRGLHKGTLTPASAKRRQVRETPILKTRGWRRAAELSEADSRLWYGEEAQVRYLPENDQSRMTGQNEGNRRPRTMGNERRGKGIRGRSTAPGNDPTRNHIRSLVPSSPSPQGAPTLEIAAQK